VGGGRGSEKCGKGEQITGDREEDNARNRKTEQMAIGTINNKKRNQQKQEHRQIETAPTKRRER
jgi:hypothetical protein